jgi:hypothetical protein
MDVAESLVELIGAPYLDADTLRSRQGTVHR